MQASYGETKGQNIARALLNRLTREQIEFNKIVEAQKHQCAKMLAADAGIEQSMVAHYGPELVIVSRIFLDPADINGVGLRVECYQDDTKYAVIRSEDLTV